MMKKRRSYPFRRADDDLDIPGLGKLPGVVRRNEWAFGEGRIQPSFRPETRFGANDRTAAATPAQVGVVRASHP
jgi:hypothetical protein